MPAEVRGALASLTFEQTRTQGMNCPGGTHSGSHPHLIDPSFLNDQAMEDQASPVEDIEAFTQRMLTLIAKRTKQWTSDKKDGQTSSTARAKQPTAVPCRTVEGHRSRSSKENAEEAISVSVKHSKENPQMRKVDATSKKDGNRSPVVLKTVLAVTLEEPTEKQRRSTLNTSSSQEERKSPKLDSNKTVDDFGHLPDGFENTEHIPEEGQPQRSTEFVEGVSFDKVHGLAENLRTESVPVKKTFEPPSQNDSESVKNESAQHNSSLSDLKDVTYSELNLSVDKIQSSDDLCVPSSGSLSDKVSVKEIAHDTEYEGITDTSQSDTKLCDAHSEVVIRPSWCDELQFEDISEDSMDEKPLISVSPQDTQPKRKQTQFTNGGYVHEQDVACMKQESIPNEELIEESVPPKTFEQAHHNPHLSVNECGYGDVDDYWIVIPVTISDLRYEPEEDEDQKGLVQPDDYKKKVSEIQSNKNETLWSGLTPTSTRASSKVEVFETGNSSEQVTGAHVRDKYQVGPSRSAHDCKVDNSGEPVLQKRSDQNPDCSDSDDSCDTEDSCDYPSVSKHNHMTVSGHFFSEIPAPLSPPPLATAKKTEEQQDKNVPNGKRTGLNKFKDKLRQIIQGKNSTKHTTNGEKGRSESSKDFSFDQHGIPSPGGVDTHKDSSPSVDLQTLRGHPTPCATQSRRVMQDAQLSDRTGTSERQIVTEAEPKFVQHETKKRNNPNKDAKITESDSKSKTDRNYKRKRKRKEIASENSEDTSSTGQLAPQRLSTLHGEGLEEPTQDPCSDLQTETNADSGSDRHRITDDIIIIDSDTEDESDYYLKNNATKRTFSSSKTISEPAQHKATDDVIILSDDESNINNKERHKTTTVTSGLADCNDTGCEQQLMYSTEIGGIEFKAGEEKHKETTMPSVSSSHSSNLRDTQSKESKQVDPYFTSKRNVQHRTTMQNVSKVSTDSDQECRRKHVSKKVSYRRRILSSTETEDSSDERMSPIEQRPLLECQEGHSKKATRKPETDRPLPEDLSKKAHKSMGFIPIIPSLSVSSLDPSQSRLKLHPLKKSSMVQATTILPQLLSRQSSFPPYVGPSTSSSNMSSSSTPPKIERRISVPSGDLPFSGVSRKASDPSKSRQNTYTSTPPSTTAKTQPLNSCRSPDQISSPTEGSSYSTTPLTRTRILEEWRSTFPNKGEVRRRRRRRPWLDDNLGTTCLESSREVVPRPSWDKTKEARPGPRSDAIGEGRPGPSHSDFSGATRPDPLRAAGPEPRSRKRRVLLKRNKSFETTAPLMKKTKIYYNQLPKATNREPAQGQSYPVGENYKWGQPKKGPSREDKLS